MDLLKALFWAAVLAALFLVVMTFIAVAFPVIVFGLLVFAIWLILKMTKDQGANTDPDG